MGGSKSHSEFFFEQSSKNNHKLVLIFWSSIPCVFCLYIAKSFGYYDLSVRSMSMMGSKKTSLDGGWVGGWGELHPSLFSIVGEKNLLCKPLSFDAESRSTKEEME